MIKFEVLGSYFKNIAFPVGAFLLATIPCLFVVSGDHYTMIIYLHIDDRNLNAQKAYL